MKNYDFLLDALEKTPLIDCHDHSTQCGPKYEDAMQLIAHGYFEADLQTCARPGEFDFAMDGERSLEERWPVIERLWNNAKNTGYGKVTRLVLKEFHGIDKLTLEAMQALQDDLPDYTDRALFDSVLEKAGIEARLEDCWPDRKAVLNGSYELTPRGRLVISLPAFHSIKSRREVDINTACLNRRVTNLDDYLAACREIFEGFKKYGAVAFKDQSAYTRPIDYGLPTREAAEREFNWFMSDPLRVAGYPEGTKQLSDYLFHRFMDMAAQMELPVQIHTGHLAGIYGDIRWANAVQLIPLIDLHKDVNFDIFHANWPYAGEFLYLGKNFPNVHLDFCWANIIDPVYCRRVFRQALSAVPRGKIHAFGSDFGGCPNRAWAHAKIARENIAMALAEAIDDGDCDRDEAVETGRMWLYANPKQFFGL